MQGTGSKEPSRRSSFRTARQVLETPTLQSSKQHLKPVRHLSPTSVPEAAAPHGGRLPRCPLPPRDHGLHRGWTDRPAPQKALSRGPCGRPPRRQACRVDPVGLTPSCVSPGRSPQLSPLFPALLAPGHLPRRSTCRASPVPADKEPPRAPHGAAEAPCLCRARLPTSGRGCGRTTGEQTPRPGGRVLTVKCSWDL